MQECGRPRLLVLITTSIVLVSVLTAGLQASRMKPTILTPSSFKHYVEQFNQEDQAAGQLLRLSIPNGVAWSFLEQNIPWFDCPDKQIEETYYYRWWCYRKHLTHTPDGWVVTEFLPPVPWAGSFNTISCAAGHHLYEGRWLRDPQYMNDYAEFWLYPEAQPRNYSFWAADAIRAVTLATGNRGLSQRLLPNLVANYRAWEKTNRDPSGLFHQIADRDGMEYSLGGSGYRPSINSVTLRDIWRKVLRIKWRNSDHRAKSPGANEALFVSAYAK